jgi:hypothetical protein
MPTQTDALSFGWALRALSAQVAVGRPRPYLLSMKNPFRYFDSSPDVIRVAVQMYVRYPLSLRNVEDLLAERGIEICRETVRLWWNRFGPMFAAEIRGNGSTGCGDARTGHGTSTRFMSKSMARCITCGGPSTTRGRC